MRVVIQRVLNASVVIEQKTHASIGKGLMILLGVEENDSIEDITWLTQKIAQLRIFEDENGLMNISVLDIAGEILEGEVVSFWQWAQQNWRVILIAH